MTIDDWRVAAGGADVSVRHYQPARPVNDWLVIAPGAGAGHDHPFMGAFGRGLAARGLQVVTFNFPYVERGRRVPDPNDTLEGCWRAVLAAVAEKAGPHGRLAAGGKSMGGRIASQVAARMETRSAGATALQVAPVAIRGLVFLGYPLHPPGRPQQLRTSHWPHIRQPALFVQGSRDPFGSPDELRAVFPRFRGATMLLVVEGGDHSLAVPRKSGRAQEDVYAQVQDAIADWVTRVCRGSE